MTGLRIIMTLSRTSYRGPQHRDINKEQYFTDPKIAKNFVRNIDNLYRFDDYDFILEPSAGSGNILQYLPSEKRIGLDLIPQIDEVVETDFFDWEPDNWNPLFGETPKIITIGNPPFGRNSDLALRFFRHASQYSDVICFIIPITWEKYSIHKKIPSDFGLYYSEVLDPLGFVFPDGSRIKNPIRCVAQCWSRYRPNTDNIRKHRPPKSFHEDFEIVASDDFDLWMAYWGGGRKEVFLTKEQMVERGGSTSGFRKIKFNNPDALTTFLSIDWEKETLDKNVGCWNLAEGTLVDTYENQRIYQKPKRHHSDFEVIKDDRDFDVWMAWWGSGHKEIFLPPETDASACFRKIKFHTPEAEKVFKSIDWKAETEYLNVGVWALSEDDLVKKYEEK